MDLKSYIREIPDWPTVGVNFKDLSPLLKDKQAFRHVIDWFILSYKDERIETIVGIDARGFILASAVAYALNTGLVMIRKKGKLPWKTIGQEYLLEYASNTIEIHEDAIKRGERVLIVDDVLATGGTMQATAKLVEKLGGIIVGIGFLIDLTFLRGSEKLKHYPVKSLIHY